MIFKNLIPMVLILLFTKVQGQPTLPNVIPPSPNASTLTKTFDYPVSNSTGIPDISIPLYTISCGQLNLPISLSYHSSGRKVDDRTGPIGLGWSLNAGGMISRVIYGDADDDDNFPYPNPWKKASDLRVDRDYLFLTAIDNRWLVNQIRYDTQYDVFTYFANGISGNFVLKDVNNTKVPTLIPKKPYLIQWNKASDYFNIVDDNGIIYRFGKNILNNISYDEWSNHKTGWMLTEIISANYEDTIHFKYRSFNSVKKSYNTVYYKKTDGNFLNEITGREESSSDIYTSQRLTEIDYRLGKVIFNLQQQDGYPPDHELLVNNIEIKSNDNTTIKKIEFTQSILNRMSDGIMPIYKLDKIVFKDKLQLPVETYSLDYYPTVDEINVRYCDFWGYYNASGKLDMCPFIPTYVGNEIIVNPNANRNTNFEAMKSGVLKSITYPTGGSTEFIYQANQYYDQGAIKPCGGLRIYQIKSTENNKTLLKTYRYGINECGYGFLPFVPSYSTMSYTTAHWNLCGENCITSCNNCYNETQFFSNILPIFSYVASKPVIYHNVTEYQGDESNNTGKIVYTYDGDDMTPPTLQAYGSGMVNYRLWQKSDLTTKSIYSKTNDQSNPYKLIKTVSNNYTETEYPSETIYGLMLWRKYIMTPESGWCPNGTSGNSWCRNGSCFTEEYYAQNSYGALPIYGFGDYTYMVGKKELTSIIETEQTSNGIFSSNTTNIFDTNHLLKEQNTIDSRGNTLKKEFLHPVDFSSTPYSEMLTRNMVNPVIQVNEYSNSTLLQSTKTNYGFYQNNKIIAPSTVDTKKGSENYEPRLTYHDYDNKGNILSVSKKDDIKESYLWGYNQTYPIAKAVNATPNQMAYTSFEDANEKGRWEFTYNSTNTCNSTCTSAATSAATQAYNSCISSCNTSCGANQSCYSTCRNGCQSAYNGVYSQVYNSCLSGCQDNAKVGNQYFGGSSVSISGLPSGNYKVGCWIKKTGTSNGTLTVNGTSNTISASTWQYKEFTVNSATSVTLSLTGVGIDELRLCPQGAQMTTYTYKPLVGMTSAADENGQVTYYEYDSFGRLKTIKDSAGNILKSYDYHYKQ